MLDGTMIAAGSSKVRNRESQAGFSMVIALVLLLFLGIVGTSLCSVLSVSHSSGLSRLHSAKSYYIAQAGLQWALRNRTILPGEVSFGGGTITVVDQTQWRFVVDGSFGATARRTRGFRSIEYCPGSRDESSSPEDVEFYVQNQTGYTIEFNRFEIEWSGPTAYYGKVRMTEEGDDDLTTVWDKTWSFGRRAGSGEIKNIWFSRTVAPGETIQIVFEDFESGRYGGSDRDMSSVPLKLFFYKNSYNYQYTVVGVD